MLRRSGQPVHLDGAARDSPVHLYGAARRTPSRSRIGSEFSRHRAAGQAAPPTDTAHHVGCQSNDCSPKLPPTPVRRDHPLFFDDFLPCLARRAASRKCQSSFFPPARRSRPGSMRVSVKSWRRCVLKQPGRQDPSVDHRYALGADIHKGTWLVDAVRNGTAWNTKQPDKLLISDLDPAWTPAPVWRGPCIYMY